MFMFVRVYFPCILNLWLRILISFVFPLGHEEVSVTRCSARCDVFDLFDRRLKELGQRLSAEVLKGLHPEAFH